MMPSQVTFACSSTRALGVVCNLLALSVLLIAAPIGGPAQELETPWQVDSSMLDCGSATVTSGDSLTIRLGENHPREIAVLRHSDGVWLFLVVGNPPAMMEPLFSREEFEDVRVIVIDSETTGFAWKPDGTNERIFGQKGKYSVYLSDILESETGGFVCTFVVG